MNISGLGYSKATRGLKDSRDHMDKEFKLIFIYPMLVDNSLRQYSNMLRDFIAINALKEIFISNAINMVQMAAQIHPLTDERGQEYDIETSTGKIDVEMDRWGRGGSYENERKIPKDNEMVKQELKHQIQRKTAVIKKLVKSDPAYKPYNPYIEMITMDNFIDVPVIVGTKMYQLDSVTTMMLMMACVSEERYHLGKDAPLDEIFNELKKLSPEKSWNLMKKITKRPTKEKGLIARFIMNNIINPIKSEFGFYKGQASNAISKSIGNNAFFKEVGKGKDIALSTLNDVNKRILAGEEPLNTTDTMAILKTSQSNLDQVKLFFKFCLDPRIMVGLHGTDKQHQQFDITGAKLAGPVKDVFNNMHSRFIKTMAIYGKPIISSFIHMLYPINAQVDTVKLQEGIMGDFNNEIMKYIESTLYPALTAGLSDITTSNDKTKRLKGMCTKDFADTDGIAKKFMRRLDGKYIRSPGDAINSVSVYGSELDDIAREAEGHIKRVELLISKILDTEIHMDYITGVINDLFNNIYNKLKVYYVNNPNNVPLTRALNSKGTPHVTDMKELLTYVDSFANASALYITFLFTYQFQVALCEFIEVVEVHVETSHNDVLDFPNYTLVLPIETIVAITNAFVARGWRDLVSREMSSGTPRDVNSNYIKGMVKFIANKLKVPNIFVIDRMKGDVYYKMMYNSKPKNTKLSTIETFIKLNQDTNSTTW